MWSDKIKDNCDFGLDYNSWQKFQEETQTFLKVPKGVSCKIEDAYQNHKSVCPLNSTYASGGTKTVQESPSHHDEFSS